MATVHPVFLVQTGRAEGLLGDSQLLPNWPCFNWAPLLGQVGQVWGEGWVSASSLGVSDTRLCGRGGGGVPVFLEPVSWQGEGMCHQCKRPTKGSLCDAVRVRPQKKEGAVGAEIPRSRPGLTLAMGGL